MALKHIIQIILQGRDDASAAFNNVGTSATRLQRTMAAVGTFMKSPLGLVGGAAGATIAIERMIGGFIRSGEELVDLSNRLQLPIDFLSEMRYVAGQTGVQFEQLAIGLQYGQRRLEEFAKTGKGDAAEFFKEFSIQAESIEEALPKIANAFKELSRQGRGTAEAMALFGRGGGALLQFMREGADSVQKLREEAHQFGAMMGDEAKTAEKLGDNVAKWRMLLDEFRNETLTPLGQGFNRLSEQIFKADRAWRQFQQTDLWLVLQGPVMLPEIFTKRAIQQTFPKGAGSISGAPGFDIFNPSGAAFQGPILPEQIRLQRATEAALELAGRRADVQEMERFLSVEQQLAEVREGATVWAKVEIEDRVKLIEIDERRTEGAKKAAERMEEEAKAFHEISLEAFAAGNAMAAFSDSILASKDAFEALKSAALAALRAIQNEFINMSIEGKRKGILGFGGSVLGSIVGGPVGGLIGGALGGLLGREPGPAPRQAAMASSLRREMRRSERVAGW